ncbi:MAG: SOS response-associated peptidase [Bacteroidota bacterium]|nr:SOS response-associated peptidase [Bacteroidota bacterium]
MCGRFSLTKEELEIEKRFNAKFYSNDLVKRYNVAPSQLALVLTDEKPNELQLYKWGLIPSWAKESSMGYKMINAKSETIFEKPSFRNLIRKRRCLVISDGFYEWKLLTGKLKQPYRIGLKGDELFAFAGLWDDWTDKETGELIPTFTIITTEANPLVLPVHDRMPVVLPRNAEATWLSLQTKDNEIKELLKPYPDTEMKAYPVSGLVNSPKNDCEDLILEIKEM